MDKKVILEQLFDKKLIKILKIFINNSEEEYYIREIAKQTRVPVATTFRIIIKLKELNIINENKIKKFKLYSLNKENSKFLSDFLEDKQSALTEFVEQVSKLERVNSIILHGKEEKDKASILIIGENIDTDAIRQSVVSIKEKYKFSIIYLTLARIQFNQMSSMGLYPGIKQILFEK
jgi:DNA-binding transcriptional regulator YhcF (GntR family)